MSEQVTYGDSRRMLQERAAELDLDCELVIYSDDRKRGIVRLESNGTIRLHDGSAWRKAGIADALALLKREGSR